jgi:hypothetical protein
MSNPLSCQHAFEPSIALDHNPFVKAIQLLIAEDMIIFLPMVHVAWLNTNHPFIVQQGFNNFLYFFFEMRFTLIYLEFNPEWYFS